MILAKIRKSFIERNLAGLAGMLGRAALAEATASNGGWLQSLDPRAKMVGFLLLVVAVVSGHRLAVVGAIMLLAFVLAATSRIPLRALAAQCGGVFVFTGPVALPSIFLTPGPAIYTWPGGNWAITAPGLRAAGMLLLRAETTAALALILVLSTRWAHVLKALRVLRAPGGLVMILGMTHRYIFLLLHLAEEFFMARRSRVVGALSAGQRRAVAVGTAGVLLGKSLQLSGEVFEAMQSRGFRGETPALDHFRWRPRDTLAVVAVAAVAGVALWLGRP